MTLICEASRTFLSAYSLEMAPKDAAILAQASVMLPTPEAVFIPFLPSDTLDNRIAAAAAVTQLGYRAVPHISARRLASMDALDAMLRRLTREACVDTVLLIAGDPVTLAGPFPDSLSIVRSGLLEAAGIRRVCIAGHPEGHAAIDAGNIWQALESKIRALNDLGLETEIVTQFSFDATAILDWIGQVRSRGITEPIAIGVPGPASVKTLLRFAGVCGVGASTKAIAKYGLSLSRLLSKTGPEKFLDELAMGLSSDTLGTVRAHLYPFGGFADTADWLREKLPGTGLRCAAR